ncbi:hypothetical protein T11_623 [Trichinella zimbabwensis]|uniref:Uncharacterized protein n=1 Tax=Trichinella zimbabwensis TaxID=268475 RepID=A0A0V1HRD7_9BILA|nr:hypothetical protein T11_623 [Trichinella zimbabwensis]
MMMVMFCEICPKSDTRNCPGYCRSCWSGVVREQVQLLTCRPLVSVRCIIYYYHQHCPQRCCLVTVDKYGWVGQQEIQVVRSTWDGLLKNCPNKPVPGDNRLLGVALVASCTAPYMERARSGTSDSNWLA